jgi:hypothetical protein
MTDTFLLVLAIAGGVVGGAVVLVYLVWSFRRP